MRVRIGCLTVDVVRPFDLAKCDITICVVSVIENCEHEVIM